MGVALCWRNASFTEGEMGVTDERGTLQRESCHGHGIMCSVHGIPVGLEVRPIGYEVVYHSMSYTNIVGPLQGSAHDHQQGSEQHQSPRTCWPIGTLWAHGNPMGPWNPMAHVNPVVPRESHGNPMGPLDSNQHVGHASIMDTMPAPSAHF